MENVSKRLKDFFEIIDDEAAFKVVFAVYANMFADEELNGTMGLIKSVEVE